MSKKSRYDKLTPLDALKEFRDKRLYRETDATFIAYCRRRWGIPLFQLKRLFPEEFTK